MESQRKIQTWKIKQTVTHALSLCLSIEMEFLERIWPTDQPEMGKQAVKHTTIEWTIECKGERVIQRITYRKWRKFVVFFLFNFQCTVHKKKKNVRWQTSGFGVHVYFAGYGTSRAELKVVENSKFTFVVFASWGSFSCSFLVPKTKTNKPDWRYTIRWIIKQQCYPFYVHLFDAKYCSKPYIFISSVWIGYWTHSIH